MAIDRASAAGCTDADIAVAFAEHVDEDFADPRQFDRWASDAQDKRLDEEKARREHAERLRREHEHDELVAKQQETSEYTAALAAFKHDVSARRLREMPA